MGKEEEVLLKGIAMLSKCGKAFKCIDNSGCYVCPKALLKAQQILTKAREAVGGAGLTPEDIMAIKMPAFVDGTKLAIRDIKVMGKAIAEAQTRAALKALGDE